MTSMTDQFETLSTRAQDTLTTTARTWADTVQSLTDAVVAAQPDPKSVVDRWFDVAQQLLDEQRRFAPTVVTTETVVEQAKSAAAQTVDAVSAAAQRTTRTAQAAAEN